MIRDYSPKQRSGFRLQSAAVAFAGLRYVNMMRNTECTGTAEKQCSATVPHGCRWSQVQLFAG